LAKEEPFIPRVDAERVRQQIAKTGEAALAKLAAELPLYGKRKNGQGRRVIHKLPERWVRNFKAVADQLRRDYRLDPTSEHKPPAEDASAPPLPADPLEGLRVASDDEEAA
jgi:hypothetical protein